MTGARRLILSVLEGEFAVAQMAAEASLPLWAARGVLWAVVGAPGEVSVVTGAANVPADVRAEGGWTALRLHGPIPFELTGILAAILDPLRDAGVGIFALSTFDTDYVLVKADRLTDALAALRQAGHEITDA
ncbi:ACT domain-containing protein [Deinococcus apachensis]|uniref:ACT domain-containing protein n=1 Tax=Deinococcus apachensis TaxID=309886 RepID=UPI0003806330|nr:ACT domain-containing protein [Deinococcus apachensis]